ncbi:carbohydrate ABC transporter permease [Protaetiibacter mangrovi]|uniref:Sugar ABC transporter permease n=1 Tax=Protaetiibacter mangrovi TaxID=2970926 RepID=A0ABT1ZGQ2_9MICO|nr:sugar ABC transporter permease [Protaetiibacter mangrovi]MCS0499886.1 sugar ABC transporter permease [Protaetiibacter mangrovi]
MRLTRPTALLFIAPALILFILFTVYPAVSGLWLSFTDARGALAGDFIGIENYVKAFTDPKAAAALQNTIVFTVISVVLQNALALALARWMYSHTRLQGFARVGTLVPAMMATVAVAYIWSYIYSPITGPLNTLLRAVGLDGAAKIWLGDPTTALAAIAVVNVWMFTGYAATIYLSGFLSIPSTIFEAAAIDGARGWKLFRSVEWPLLAPAFTVNLTLSTIGALRVFDLILLMTKGGPGFSTESISYVIFNESFGKLNYGYGSSLAVILLILTVIVSFILTTVLRRREVEW